MRFSQIVSLTLVSSVFAAPQMVKRQIGVITAQIDAVNAKITIIDGTVNTLAAGSDIAAITATLTAQSGDIVAALGSGTSAISAATELSLTDAVSLNTYSNALVDNVSKVVDDFIAKKDIIVGAGQSATVVQQLQAQKDASTPFIAAIVSKVPSAAQSIAQSQAGKVITALDRGIAAFQ